VRATLSLDNLCLDVRYALRSARRNPAFAATAILILALGIGGNTAMFSVVRAVLLKRLAYSSPDRLVEISLDNPRLPASTGAFTILRYDDLRNNSRSFLSVGAYSRLTEDMALSGTGNPEMLKGARVSANFLDILGIPPAVGRAFIPAEDEPGAAPVAMISYRLWKRRFAGDPDLPGKAVIFNSIPHTIIGVLPAGFEFPRPDLDVWVPRPSETSALPSRFWPFVTTLRGFGRLRPGVSLDQARAEAAVLNRQYLAANPARLDGRAGASFRLIPMKEQLVSGVRTILWLLFGAVGFVLLIACANVAGLLLTRGAWRAREFAVRAAIGAARTRLVAQSLVESLILAAAGGLLGVLLANWVLATITHMPALALPRSGEVRLDSAVLAFSIAVACLTGILSGLLPALQAPASNIADLLRESGAAAVGAGAARFGRMRQLGLNSRGLLVIVQIALSIVLLIGAALLMESVVRLRSVDPGLRPADLFTARIALSPARNDTNPKILAFFDELLRRVSSLPGVRGAALSLALPQSVALRTNVQVGVQPEGDVTKWPMCQLQTVTPGYFRLLGIPIREGREFDERDIRPDAPPVALINESFARLFAPHGESLVGQVMREGIDKSGWMQIAGIVGDVREAGLAAEPTPEFYVTARMHSSRTAYLIARTESDPLRLAAPIRTQVLSIDRDQPISDIATMDQIIESSIGSRRSTMLLLNLFAAIALLLATVGIYGAIAFSGVQRTQELGIRRALGAQDHDILRLMLGQGILLALIGSALGIAGALTLTRLMRSLLYRISPADFLTYLGVTLLWIAVALAASYIPARRAARIDPAQALRIG